MAAADDSSVWPDCAILKVLGDMVSIKRSPNAWWIFGLKWTATFLMLNYCDYFLGNFWNNLGYFLIYHLVTLLMRQFLLRWRQQHDGHGKRKKPFSLLFLDGAKRSNLIGSRLTFFRCLDQWEASKRPAREKTWRERKLGWERIVVFVFLFLLHLARLVSSRGMVRPCRLAESAPHNEKKLSDAFFEYVICLHKIWMSKEVNF